MPYDEATGKFYDEGLRDGFRNSPIGSVLLDALGRTQLGYHQAKAQWQSEIDELQAKSDREQEAFLSEVKRTGGDLRTTIDAEALGPVTRALQGFQENIPHWSSEEHRWITPGETPIGRALRDLPEQLKVHGKSVIERGGVKGVYGESLAARKAENDKILKEHEAQLEAQAKARGEPWERELLFGKSTASGSKPSSEPSIALSQAPGSGVLRRGASAAPPAAPGPSAPGTGFSYPTPPGRSEPLDAPLLQDRSVQNKALMERFSALAPQAPPGIDEHQRRLALGASGFGVFSRAFRGKGTAGQALMAAAGNMVGTQFKMNMEMQRAEWLHQEEVRKHELAALQLQAGFDKNQMIREEKNALIGWQNRTARLAWKDEERARLGVRVQASADGRAAVITTPNAETGETELRVERLNPIQDKADRLLSMLKIHEALEGRSTSAMTVTNKFGDAVELSDIPEELHRNTINVSLWMTGVGGQGPYEKAFAEAKENKLKERMIELGRTDFTNQDDREIATFSLLENDYKTKTPEEVLYSDIWDIMFQMTIDTPQIMSDYENPQMLPFLNFLEGATR